ncbi:peptide chain release factor N(5)-glutamine methyltransferase [Desulfogranum mediterraneum]|uniref:peptide chain release factor N(5)-glutamine methyltransferase n=1 Tax=Desulfogranum mediterraneum TaxID=160661 RepID=UPI00040CFE4F|nr:peptide chain release factor N(5)-glutamine methyltransferase [Desulfogranum mediterraneum]
MQISDLLTEASLSLQAAGIEEYRLDARLLWQFVSRMSRTDLVLHGGQEAAVAEEEQFLALVEQRARRIPLHYITGSREFWSLDFQVSPAVLIPRPETEFVLSHVLEQVRASGGARRALDMCTGSGVIGVVLNRELACPVTLVDLSAAALEMAARNVASHCPGGELTLLCSDLFSALRPERQFDLIVSNPPYISDADLRDLEPEVSVSEPRLALSGGSSGLEIIGRVISQAHTFLSPGGWLFLEIGAEQGAAVSELCRQQGDRYREVAVLPDWAGRDRLFQARLRR